MSEDLKRVNEAADAAKPAGELSDEQLGHAQGGNSISIEAKMPDYTGPKLHAPGSIAQGEINSNSTDDNLSDSGGGVIA
jgi:hypothetical protein